MDSWRVVVVGCRENLMAFMNWLYVLSGVWRILVGWFMLVFFRS